MGTVHRTKMSVSFSNDSVRSKVMELTDFEMRKDIWGPWYWYISVFKLVFPAPKKGASFFEKLWQFLPNVIVLGILAVRAGNIMWVMSRTNAVSYSWAYMTVFFALSVHAFTCAATLTWYKHGNFFAKMTTHIRQLAVDGFATVPKLDLILQILVIVVACFPTYLLYILDSFTMVRSYSNDNSTDVSGIYRDVFPLYIVDIPIVILSAYVTSAVFIAYLLSNSAVCRHFDTFYTKLEKCVEDGTISKLDNLKYFDQQLSNLLLSIVYLNTANSWMLSVTFVTGIVIQTCGELSLMTFKDQLQGVEYVMAAFWFAQSVAFMIFALKKPSIFQEKLILTKHLLWLDHDIWTKSTDVEVLDITESMINRIDTIDYPAKGMAQVGIRIFNLILLAVPLLVAVLAGTSRLQGSS